MGTAASIELSTPEKVAEEVSCIGEVRFCINYAYPPHRKALFVLSKLLGL